MRDEPLDLLLFKELKHGDQILSKQCRSQPFKPLDAVGDHPLSVREKPAASNAEPAIQLCTVRFLGTFLPEPTAVPRVVIAHLAKQLAIEEPSCLARYRERVETHHAYATEIQRRRGYRDFHQQPEHFRLVRWLRTDPVLEC
jgi:Domain of unknown function (DUF4158)